MSNEAQIHRINATLRGLKAVANPSPAMVELIAYYLTELHRLAPKAFVPYPDTDDVMIINELGDREDDL